MGPCKDSFLFSPSYVDSGGLVYCFGNLVLVVDGRGANGSRLPSRLFWPTSRFLASFYVGNYGKLVRGRRLKV